MITDFENDGGFTIKTDFHDAAEVANDVMYNGFDNFDPQDWRSYREDDAASAFWDLVTMYADYKFSHALTTVENKAELLNKLKESMENTIMRMAERQILDSRYNGLKAAA